MKKALAAALLLATTFIWGVTFTVVKEAVDRVEIAVFLAQRFLLATLLMLPFALARRRSFDRRAIARGSAMGAVLFAVYAFQTVALRHATASNTAFLTSLSVVLVPMIGAVFLRRPISGRIRLAVALALAGLFLLCTNCSRHFNPGDLLAMVTAVWVSLHLLLTGAFAPKSDVYWLTLIEIGVVALCSLAWALGAGETVFLWRPFLLWPLVICVLFATIFAFLVQTSTQRLLSPTHTALIFCLEPVFAALWAFFALGERFSPAGYLGASLILGAMLVAELEKEQHGEI